MSTETQRQNVTTCSGSREGYPVARSTKYDLLDHVRLCRKTLSVEPRFRRFMFRKVSLSVCPFIYLVMSS